MRKAAGKRLPHGATLALVLAALWHLHLRTGKPQPVSRTDLFQALALPETTVDDRLRVLVKKGWVLRAGRALYSPVHQKGRIPFDKYWRHRPPPDWSPSSDERLKEAARHPKPPGAKEVLIFPEGVVMIEAWQSVADYIRTESIRQREEYLAKGWIPPGDDVRGD